MGVPDKTANEFTKVTTSDFVVRVTLRGPVDAVGSMLMRAVALVAEATVKDVTVIPAPKDACVIPCAKCVNCPVIATGRPCCPCWPVVGLNCVKTGVPAVNVKPLVKVSTSAFVVSVTLRGPMDAAGSIFISAVALVAEATVTETTVTPDPKFAVVAPCIK